MMFQRGPVTAALLSILDNLGFPIGDAAAPAAGGWGGDQNAPGNVFTPYVVVTALNAVNGRGPLTNSEGDFVLPYALTCFGLTRVQVEAVADKARAAADVLGGTKVTLPSGRVIAIQRVMLQAIGGITRVTTIEPNYYMQSDVIGLWTSE